MYNPANWYWAGEPDGRSAPIIYSATQGKVVAATDAAYEAWAATNAPTPWPKDATGVVTAAALDEVLVAAGLPATGLGPATVPASVSDLQFRLALNASGLRDKAEAYIATASQDVKDWWDRATRIDRDNAMLAAAVTAIGKTPADRDALFTLAATL
jgi:hypothetical protein